MQYLTATDEIRAAIARLERAEILWLDTEVADWQTPQPRLSLIQAFAEELQGAALVLDVLDRSDLVAEFVDRIMANAAIEKVFHNASFDKRFLGRTRARNVTCTLQMARKIPKQVLGTADRKLATLVRAFCPDSTVDKTEQTSDWGRRPLTPAQLHYAGMDAVYLERVHRGLLARSQPQVSSLPTPSSPAKEDIAALAQRYRQIEAQWQQLDTEIAELKDRLKAAMQAQSVDEIDGFQLSRQRRVTQKIFVTELARLLQSSESARDIQITLTKAQQEQLGDLLAGASVAEQATEIVKLRIRERAAGEDC